MGRSDDEEDSILGPGKLMTQNVDEGNGSTNHAQIEPPDNPAADTQMNTHSPSVSTIMRRIWISVVAHWSYRAEIPRAWRKLYAARVILKPQGSGTRN